MAYEVTASRKRPRNFSTLVGQEFVVATLLNALKTRHIAHAYLFSGPRGVGKTSTARILARALNCPDENLLGTEACFDYPGAEEISRGTAMDVIEIDGASNTSVNDIRTIKDEVLFPPQNSRYKIYIIDEVHMLSNSAFNALLKTIEEPPHYIIFIFATTEIHKVPATIRSRCQQFNFRLIPLEEIISLLREACAEMGVKAEDDALFWIARESTGSMRDAYTLFDQVVAFSEGEITLDKIKEKLGLLGLDELNSLASLIHAGEGKDAIGYVDSLFASGASVEQLIIDLSDYYRTLLFIRQGVDRDGLLGHPRKGFSEDIVGAYRISQLEKIIELLLQCYRDVRYTLNPRLELELVISRMCRIGQYLEPQDIMHRIQGLRDSIASLPGNHAPSGIQKEKNKIRTADPGTVETQNAESHALAPTSGQSPQTEAGPESLSPAMWNQLVEKVRAVSLSIAAVLEKVNHWDYSRGVLRLVVESNMHAGTLKQEQALITGSLEQLFGVQARLDVHLESSSEQMPDEDPEVSMVKRVFRGELLE